MPFSFEHAFLTLVFVGITSFIYFLISKPNSTNLGYGISAVIGILLKHLFLSII